MNPSTSSLVFSVTEERRPWVRLFGRIMTCAHANRVGTAKIDEDPSKERIRIPTLHVHGLRDQYLLYGREQYATYFDSSTAKLHEIDYHHAMPWKPAEVQQLAEQIRNLYTGADDSALQPDTRP